MIYYQARNGSYYRMGCSFHYGLCFPFILGSPYRCWMVFFMLFDLSHTIIFSFVGAFSKLCIFLAFLTGAFLSLLWLPQVKIVKRCRDLGIGAGGFYQPGYREGGKLHLKMMCLGKNWDPDSSTYGDVRPFDDTKPPNLPDEFYQLVEKAIKDSYAIMGKDSTIKYPERVLPWMKPNICIVNFYSQNGRLGLHQVCNNGSYALYFLNCVQHLHNSSIVIFVSFSSLRIVMKVKQVSKKDCLSSPSPLATLQNSYLVIIVTLIKQRKLLCNPEIS